MLLDASTTKGKQLYQLIAQMGDVANCEVVAEGVETEDEFKFVAECGVDKVQGFLIARPQPLSEALKLIKLNEQIDTNRNK